MYEHKHNTETVPKTMLKQFSRHVIHGIWMHTGLAHAPCGWMADEAGANWAGLREVFGSSVISRAISCQFQCQQSCLELNSSKSKTEFKQLARGFMKSDTLSGFAQRNASIRYNKTTQAWLPENLVGLVVCQEISCIQCLSSN